VNDLAHSVETLAMFETRHATRRERTLIAQSGADLAEQLRRLPPGWLVKSVSRRQFRFVVRVFTVEFK
jgi:hypothetical protein